MHGLPFAERLLLAPAVLLVQVAEAAACAWRGVRRGLEHLGRAGPLCALRMRIARLPPAIALTLFLVPEACSRGGWFTSAWLLMQGHGRTALLVYGGTKLTAGAAALWIFHACEPSLMRVHWFAATRGWSVDKARALRARLLPCRPPSPLFARARLILAQTRPGAER